MKSFSRDYKPGCFPRFIAFIWVYPLGKAPLKGDLSKGGKVILCLWHSNCIKQIFNCRSSQAATARGFLLATLDTHHRPVATATMGCSVDSCQSQSGVKAKSCFPTKKSLQYRSSFKPGSQTKMTNCGDIFGRASNKLHRETALKTAIVHYKYHCCKSSFLS